MPVPENLPEVLMKDNQAIMENWLMPLVGLARNNCRIHDSNPKTRTPGPS